MHLITEQWLLINSLLYEHIDCHITWPLMDVFYVPAMFMSSHCPSSIVMNLIILTNKPVFQYKIFFFSIPRPPAQIFLYVCPF